MVMSRSTFNVGTIGLLEEGLREVFFEWLDLKTAIYPQIYEVKTTKKRRETDHTVAGLGTLVKKTEGASITYDDMVDGYELQYTPSTYALGVRITEELVEDELYGVMEKRTQALANSARYRFESDASSLFNNATNTNIATVADGLSLMNDAHTLAGVVGTTVDNSVASSLTLSALESAFTHFRTLVNDRNLKIAMQPAVLLVPPQLEFDAYEIVNSSLKPYTADNETNFFKGRLRIIVWDFLTDTNGWFVLADKKYGAPQWFNRVPMQFKRDGDFDTGDLKMKARCRYAFGSTDWRWLYGSTGAT